MWEITLHHQGEVGLSAQIYQYFKAYILSGQMAQGEALPSTRELAGELHVSRNTVCVAYDMLWTEGFIVNRQGAPSRVADGLAISASQTGEKERREDEPPKPILWDFRSGQPDLATFPWNTWRMMVKQAADSLPPDTLAYTGPKGYEPLCEEIAGWLLRSRGMEVAAEDVFITSGATQALYVLAQILQKGALPFALENPSHPGLRTVLEDRAIPILRMPVDGQGADVDVLSGKKVAAAYVTPSHQFPLGGILPAARRAALLRMAAEQDFYIIEDDYDSEFRYAGAPVSPIYAMDSLRVVYIGTFSKTMFPALRVGFAVLPKALQSKWRHVRTFMDVQNPVLEQAALAQFLLQRKLDKHVRRMRRLYGDKRAALLTAIQQTFGDAATARGDASGLHLALQFPGRSFGTDFTLHCRDAGIRIARVSKYCFSTQEHTDTLLLGYGHLDAAGIAGGVRALGRLLQNVAETRD